MGPEQTEGLNPGENLRQNPQTQNRYESPPFFWTLASLAHIGSP